MLSPLKKGNFIVFATVVILTRNAISAETNSCQNEGVLKYEPGKSYTYVYGVNAEGNLHLGRSSGDQNKPALNINGTVVLTALSQCEFVITLQETVIKSLKKEQSEGSLVNVERSSIKFTMNNGMIESIQFNSNDPSWTVNLKKTILYMFQNKLFYPNFEKDIGSEASVFGDCVTDYDSSNGEYSKRTQLKSCGQGEGSDIIFQGVSYQVPLVPNKSIFGFVRPDSLIKCTQLVDSNGILSQSRCEEGNGDRMSLVSLLKFKEATSSILKEDEITSLSTLTSSYHNFTKSYSKSMEDNAVEDIKRLLSSLKSDGSNKAEVFINLKKAVAKVSDLRQFINSEHVTEDIHQKTFYDAMSEVTTDEAIHIVAELANLDRLDTRTQLTFYMNIAFATSPGVKALDALSALVNGFRAKQAEQTNPEAASNLTAMGENLILGASGLAHQFCKLSEGQCSSVPQYQNLVNSIASYATAEGTEEDIFVASLHALGNLDSLTPEAVEAIKKVLDSSPANWLEIQALDAFRRDPCQQALKDTARTIFSDSQKSDQIRIHAYLAMSRCIVSDDVTEISKIMSDVNSPIAGFIGSHIRNVMDSSSPSKNYLKEALGQITVPENILVVHNSSRSSRFMEYSTFNEKQNVGISGEAILIFVPGQTKPEFVSFNGTLDLFGKSFNFFEIGLSQRLAMRTQMYASDDAPAEWCCFDSAIMAKDSYIRVLGTTIGVGLDDLKEAFQSSAKQISSGQVPSYAIDMIQPNTLLDEEIIFPSISGLPLSLDLDAVSFDSFKLETMGEFADIGKIFEGQNVPVKVKFNMNGDQAATIKGSVGLGSHTPVHVGYKASGKVDQSHSYGVEISTSGSENLDMDVKLNFPNQILFKKQATFEIDAFEEIDGVMKPSKSKSLPGSTLVSQPKECWNFKTLGLKACSSKRISSGLPFMMTNSIEKENPEMEGFDIKLKADGAETYSLTVSTPGSSTSRSLKLTAKLEQGNEERPDFWEYKEINVMADLEKSKYSGRLSINKTQVPELNGLLPYDLDISVTYSANSRKSIEVIKFKTQTPKESAINVNANFDGPLALLGEIKYNQDFDDKTDRNDETRYYRQNFVCSKHLEWDSEVFGKTVFDVERRVNGSENSIDAKLDCHGQVYELKQSSQVSYIYGEPKESTLNYGETIKFRPTKERLEKHKLMMHLPHDQYEIEFGVGYEEVKEHKYKNNVSLDIISSQLSHPIGVKVFVDSERGDEINELDGTLIIESNGEKQLDIKTKSDLEKCIHEIKGDIAHFGDFSGNLSSEGQHSHFHIDFQDKERQLEIVLDSDINDDGNEYNAKSKFVLDDKKHKHVTKSETFTVMDRSKRTLDSGSKTTVDDELVSKFYLHAEITPDFWNGKSHADMQIEGKAGELILTGNVNHTMASVEDKQAKSNLAMIFKSGHGEKPFTYNWDLIVDKNSPSQQYDMEYHITSDKHITGVFLSPFDILIEKDITIHKKKDQNVYELNSQSNVTSNGYPKRTTDFAVVASGNDPEWESGSIDMDGQTKEGNFLDKFSGHLTFAGKIEETRTENITFKVTRTDEETHVTSKVIDGSVNRTQFFHNLADFKFTEAGQVMINDHNTINWIQLVRFHDKEFTILKKVEEMSEGNDKRDIFLFDVSAKLIEENHQTKFALRSQHSLAPDCPVANLNFTLSK